MNRAIAAALGAANARPVLVDIGASGAPPVVWEPLARHAIYVGFDPDRRELYDVPDGRYARSIIVNEAVTSAPGGEDVRFFLTRSPYCSSTLPPDERSLSDYLFADLFAVEREAVVPATTLSATLARLDLPSVDWLKTDSQGTDLRLFQSLTPEQRDGVLALDIEPGVIDAYQGEDLFVDAHRELTRQGFWLASLDVKGSVRMKRTTVQIAARQHPRLNAARVAAVVAPSPGWCEASYLRSLQSLAERQAEQRDYVLLWAFALVKRQLGFALDLALEYAGLFGAGELSALLWDAPLRELRRPSLKSVWRSGRHALGVARRLLLPARARGVR